MGQVTIAVHISFDMSNFDNECMDELHTHVEKMVRDKRFVELVSDLPGRPFVEVDDPTWSIAKVKRLGRRKCGVCSKITAYQSIVETVVGFSIVVNGMTYPNERAKIKHLQYNCKSCKAEYRGEDFNEAKLVAIEDRKGYINMMQNR